jgi:hypothetical protein
MFNIRVPPMKNCNKSSNISDVENLNKVSTKQAHIKFRY